MRISDWSSDVCSSDLDDGGICGDLVRVTPDRGRSTATIIDVAQGSWSIPRPHDHCARRTQIGDHLGIWITTFKIRKDRFQISLSYCLRSLIESLCKFLSHISISEKRRVGKEGVRQFRLRVGR